MLLKNDDWRSCFCDVDTQRHKWKSLYPFPQVYKTAFDHTSFISGLHTYCFIFFLFNLPFVFIALIVFRFTPPSPLLTMPFHWRWYYYHYIITAFQWILFLSCFCSNSPWRNPKMLVGWNAGVVFKTWNTSVIDFTIVILLAGSAMCKLSNAFRMFRLLVIVISCSASF